MRRVVFLYWPSRQTLHCAVPLKSAKLSVHLNEILSSRCDVMSIRVLWFIIFVIFCVGFVCFGWHGIPAYRQDVARTLKVSF